MGVEFRKVCNPLLPRAEDVLAYLDVPDTTRWYANRGQLVCKLEERLASYIGTGADEVLTAATGTAALEAAILVTAGQARAEAPLALMPSYTFAASALAAERCGYTPHFVDIDPETWTPDPKGLRSHPALDRVGLIVVVAPYGRLPDMRALEDLRAASGLPIVVDAAAAFEHVVADPAVVSKTVPLTLSFHATKTFSTGEGGAVLWRNPEGRAAAAQAMNFGFLNSRECRSGGFNGKMSEYHAAVGLAMLDIFDARRAAYAEIGAAYREIFAAFGVPGRLHVGPEISSAYALLMANTNTEAEALTAALTRTRFGWRRWYEDGLHGMAHFRDCGRDALPVTGSVSARLVGLPMAPDLTREEITQLAQALATAGAQARSGDPVVPGGHSRSAP